MKIFCFLLVFGYCQASEFLFYLQDAGETYALLPVAERLREEGADVEILIGGVAEGIVGDRGRPIREFVGRVDAGWARAQRVDPNLVLGVVEAIEPKVFVSGVAFALQGQLYDVCKQKGIQTVAFWDNFSSDGEDPYFRTAHEVEKKAEVLWVGTEGVAQGFSGRDNLFVVGHPSLERWVATATEVDVPSVRARLGVDGQVAVFIGGYGPLYEQSFALFLASMEEVEGLTVLVQPHPKYAGKFELEALSRRSQLPVRILDGEVSTIEAVACADLVLCHQSTVGYQAMCLGKPVVYFIPTGQQAPLFALNRVSKVGELEKILDEGLEKATVELPSNSAEYCAKLCQSRALSL